MPVQTRARAPTNRVYSSPAAQQQLRFRSPKQRVTSRRSLGAQRRSRQQTLTQIDFVNLQEAIDQDDEVDIYDEEENIRKCKRRRTEGDVLTSASRFYTQTLTQLEFVSTPASRLEDHSDEDNDLQMASTHGIKVESFSLAGNMGPPKTPSRQRLYEVPSSQSPSSPASVQRRRSSPTRPPLKALDINLRVHEYSPSRWRNSPNFKLEIEDLFEYENDSQQTKVPQTPTHKPSPIRVPKSTAERQLTTSIQRYIKDEIQDSDDSDEEDLDTQYDDQGQESQLDHFAPNPPSNDTQEAEDQLHSTMLQFTQQIPSTVEELAPLRASQATTVSLSQPPTSSLPVSRPPTNHHSYVDSRSVQDDEGHITIPDSPSNGQPLSDLSLSPTLPRLPVETQEEEEEEEEQQQRSISLRKGRMETDMMIPLVPFSLASSQMLTRSQMLPESLMNDSVPAPPLFIEDSDFEE